MKQPKDQDPEVAALLPAVYAELRRIATANMARMPMGTTLFTLGTDSMVALTLAKSGSGSIAFASKEKPPITSRSSVEFEE